MKFVLLAFLIVLIGTFVKTRAEIRRISSLRERSEAVRLALFSWFLGLLFVGALLCPLPNAGRLLFLIPAIYGGLIVAGRVRRRVQLRGEARPNFESMKRVPGKIL